MIYKSLFPEIYALDSALQTLGQCHEEAYSGRLRVLVWNMYKARIKGWREDFQTLIQNKELVILQEAVLNTNHDMIFQTQERFEWVMACTHKSKATQAVTGVKTGAIVKSTAQSFFLSRDAEPILRTPKMLLATTYPIRGYEHDLLIVNTHAINFVPFFKFNRQLEQIIEAVHGHQGPVILAGDFNTWNAARFNALLKIVYDMGLEEVKLSRKGRLVHFNKDLDHVFYRGLVVKEAEVLMAVRTSDHYPITVEFTIPPGR